MHCLDKININNVTYLLSLVTQTRQGHEGLCETLIIIIIIIINSKHSKMSQWVIQFNQIEDKEPVI